MSKDITILEKIPSLYDVAAAYDYAVEHHPDFVPTVEQAFIVLSEELGEVARAIYENNPAQMALELEQVAAVALRMLEMLRTHKKLERCKG